MAKACRVCHIIVEDNVNICPHCRVQDLSSEYTGEVFILNIEGSEIAKRMNITTPGRYALRVR